MAFVTGAKSGVRLGRDQSGNAFLDFTHSGGDISKSVLSYENPRSRPSVEVTPLAEEHTKFLKGLKGGTVTMEVLADFAAEGVSGLLKACYEADGDSYLRWVPVDKGSAASATNPYFDMKVLVLDFPLSGSVGEAAKHSVSMVVNEVYETQTSGDFAQAFHA